MIQCEICGGALLVNSGGKTATCQQCGVGYTIERLRELAGAAPQPKQPAPTPKSEAAKPQQTAIPPKPATQSGLNKTEAAVPQQTAIKPQQTAIPPKPAVQSGLKKTEAVAPQQTAVKPQQTAIPPKPAVQPVPKQPEPPKPAAEKPMQTGIQPMQTGLKPKAPAAPPPAPKKPLTEEEEAELLVKNAPTDDSEYTKYILNCATQYLHSRSEKHSLALVDLYPRTEALAKTKPIHKFTLAIHAHNLALRYVESPFRPTEAAKYAKVADESYAEAEASTPMENLNVYKNQVKIIRAYCARQADEFDEARRLMADVGVSGIGMALIATIFVNLAHEEDRVYFRPAFELFEKMDAMINEPVKWKFEEDILRAAYNFYYLYYTHQMKDPEDPDVAPKDINKALDLLYKIRALLTDPEQIEWVDEDIAQCKELL